MKKLILAVMILAVMAGCTVKKKLISSSDSDSITKIEYRERIVEKETIDTMFIPAEEDIIRALAECDSNGKLNILEMQRLKNQSRSNVDVSVHRSNDGKYVIMASGGCDSAAIFSVFKSRYEAKEAVNTMSVNNESVTQESKKTLPWWMYPSLIVALVVGGVIGYLINKFT